MNVYQFKRFNDLLVGYSYHSAEYNIIPIARRKTDDDLVESE